MNCIVAAYCYRETDVSHEIVIITSSAGRWIIPKGQPAKKFGKKRIALKEAWEEAGVTGVVSGRVRELIIKLGQKQRWKIYPVKIKKIHKKWPEKSFRKRRFVSPEEAVRAIDNRDLAKAVSSLAKRIQKN